MEERRNQPGDTLSGGEQQMLAVARAMMTGGNMILLDEPSMGLAPFLMYELFHVLKEINQQGTTILLVEQNARIALKYAHRGYVLETGNIVLEGSAKDLAPERKDQEGISGGVILRDHICLISSVIATLDHRFQTCPPVGIRLKGKKW